MNEKIADKINLLIQKANTIQKRPKVNVGHNRSSLHSVIRTREQAALFMKLLKSA